MTLVCFDLTGNSALVAPAIAASRNPFTASQSVGQTHDLYQPPQSECYSAFTVTDAL